MFLFQKCAFSVEFERKVGVFLKSTKFALS